MVRLEVIVFYKIFMDYLKSSITDQAGNKKSIHATQFA
jgi:hypothetical protein